MPHVTPFELVESAGGKHLMIMPKFATALEPLPYLSPAGVMKMWAQLQEALERLMSGRTTIVIAHRLSTVRRADVIVAMEQGRVVERGTHAELLAAGGLYRRLHDLQAFSGEGEGST